MIFTTSINANYLPKARTLAQSIKDHYPDSKFVLGFVEREPLDISNYPEFDDVLTPSNLWPEDHERILHQYDVVEACTAIKGQLMLSILDKYMDNNKVIFLDPDTQVISPMTELETVLDSESIVLTPHLTEPENTIEAIEDNEISVHRHGIFNLGFLAVSRSSEATRMLSWWADRLKRYSIADYHRGLFTDQKWMDQAPAFFDVHILKHPGYNVAPWNIGKRPLSISSDKVVVKNTYPLRFFHFSGFDSGANIAMLSKYAEKNDLIFSIRDNYIQRLKENGEYSRSKSNWTYDVPGKYKWIKTAKRMLQRNRFYPRPYQELRFTEALPYAIKLKLHTFKKALSFK